MPKALKQARIMAAALGLLSSLGGCDSASGDGSNGDQPNGGGDGSLTISGLRVEPNPKSVLSAFAIWTTNTPASEAPAPIAVSSR